MSQAEKLEELLTKSVIPDLADRLDEIFEEIAGNKEATQDAKEEIEELREFKSDLEYWNRLWIIIFGFKFLLQFSYIFYNHYKCHYFNNDI